MKLCWGNIENIRLTKNGNFRDIIEKKTYIYIESCKKCKEPFLGKVSNRYCCNSCASGSRKHTEETKKRMSECKTGSKNSFYGKHHTEETRKKLSDFFTGKLCGENNPFYGKTHSNETKRKIGLKNSRSTLPIEEYSGCYKSKDIPLYDTFKDQIEWCEEIRRNCNDINILEVKCFKCSKWFIPTLRSVRNRVSILKGVKGYKGEHHLYCSVGCKKACSIYGKQPITLMREDAVRAGRIEWIDLNREIQSELRQIVLERDGYKCIKCDATENLNCHHIYPISIEPLESADVDNCITLCDECHKEVHKLPGCGYSEIKMEVC